jgi:pimeloyl-ACP methyl ester carboxylesterase
LLHCCAGCQPAWLSFGTLGGLRRTTKQNEQLKGDLEMTIERDVKFASGSLHLAGTLRLPAVDGQWPAVLLIPGSGPVDRDENAAKFRINALHDIAVHLSEHGIATFRYDKRGVGASDGNFWETGFFDNVTDAGAALGCLRSQKEIRLDQVFLLGHSEGAMTTTRLAATGAAVNGVVLLAGPARKGEDVLVWQCEQAVKGMRGFNKWLVNFFHIDVRKKQQKQLDKIKQSSENCYRLRLTIKLNAKWFREFMAYNPADDLPEIQVPVLALTGSKDIQVDPSDLGQMARLVKSEFESHVLPNVTHLLRSEPGEPSLSTYKQQLAQPVDKIVLQTISEWLRKKAAI